MSRRRIIQLFVLAALVLAPFGRVGVAQATAGHDAPRAMVSHCAGPPVPDRGKGHRIAIDCMIACAAMTVAAAPFVLPPPAPKATPLVGPASILSGILPAADPPPPRQA